MGDTKLNFDAAQASCEGIGGNLPFFNTQEELDAFVDSYSGRQEWLGFRRGSDSSFYTVTGDEVAFYNWYGSQPDNYGGYEHCGEIIPWESNKWNDAYCANTNWYSCRLDSEVPIHKQCV